MKLVAEKILDDFDTTINRYIVFLVHVQKSTLMQVSEKIPIFDIAKNIALELKANVVKTLNNINEYNIEEKKKDLEKNLLKIEARITNEINGNKKIKIDAKALFLFSHVRETLKTKNNGIGLTDTDLANLYSYKKLNSEKEREEKLDEELGKIKNKIEKDLDELKLKAFINILHGNNINPDRFYEVNKFILNKSVKEKITLIVAENVNAGKEGFYFIMNRQNMEIRRKKENALIVYTITITGKGEQFNILIDGKINVHTDGRSSEETFRIDEIYPNNMVGAVLNTYNLREIIEIFNLLFGDFFSNNDDGDPGDNPDIDDYLSGNIKND
jgi:hypothetical protein